MTIRVTDHSVQGIALVEICREHTSITFADENVAILSITPYQVTIREVA